jgi:hypothetical protein
MVFISPKNILVEFLREKLTDPRARAEATRTETFDGGSTEYSLTPTVGTFSCITEVTVNSTDQEKWANYYIDWQNQKVIFYAATGAGSGNVSITYKQGTTNWIYPDKAKETLSPTSFPRINILSVGGTGERVGQYNSDVESSNHFQIDLWSRENQIFTINSTKYEGDRLNEYLAYEITKSFRSDESGLFPALYNYTLLGIPRDLGFDQEMQCFHKIVEVELKGINVGESK